MQEGINRQDPSLILHIRTTCRSAYDLQKLRIQAGNRISGDFRSKLGQTQDGMSKKEMMKEQKSTLDKLEASHKRITDAIVSKMKENVKNKAEKKELIRTLTRIQTDKLFIGDDLITDTGLYYLVDNYVRVLDIEKQLFADMQRLLDQIPIYTQFLEHIPGIGPAMAGVIISEIDIHEAEYPSSLVAYAGLDVVPVYQLATKEVDEEGKAVLIELSVDQAHKHKHVTFNDNGEGKVPDAFYKGTLMTYTGVGRSRRACSLVKREYTTKDNEVKLRDSITFNPFLKTKLLGVAAGSMIKAAAFRVDDKPMSAVRRLAEATEMGFVATSFSEDELDDAVITFLRASGKVVERAGSEYVKMYYDYRQRLDNNPRHKEKTDFHKNNMAKRYLIKMLLQALYTPWRKLEGLPVALPYHEGVLGKVHGVAKEAGWQDRKDGLNQNQSKDSDDIIPPPNKPSPGSQPSM